MLERIGLLGCGRHGERYLRHIRDDLPDARATALYRRDPHERERLASAYGVAACSSAEELIARDDVDLLLIATPPGNHLADLERALPSGKPILIEKPLLANAGEIDAARALIARHPESRLMVAQTLRFAPILERARALLPQIGRLHRVRIAQRLEPSDLSWQRDPAIAGGGSITLTGVHLFDLLRWLVGRTPDGVHCAMLRLSGHPLENCFDACFDYEDEQILAATEVSKFSASRSGLLELVGEREQLVVDYLRGQLDRVSGRERERVAESGDVPTLPRTLRAFLDYARGERDNPVPAEEGIETMRMAEACYRSQREGRRVALSGI